MELNGKTLKQIRASLDLTQTEFAKRIGTSQGRYSKWERGEDTPGGKYTVRILELAAGVPPLGAGGPPVRTFEIIGELQAGVWKEAIEWPHPEAFAATPPPGLGDMDVKCFYVRGTSMNRYYPDGTIVFVQPTISSGTKPKNGQHVLVTRRNKKGLYEATLKELVIDGDGGKWLWPRSSDPEHQAPIRYDDGEAEEVVITGIVRAFYGAAPQGV